MLEVADQSVRVGCGMLWIANLKRTCIRAVSRVISWKAPAPQSMTAAVPQLTVDSWPSLESPEASYTRSLCTQDLYKDLTQMYL